MNDIYDKNIKWFFANILARISFCFDNDTRIVGNLNLTVRCRCLAREPSGKTGTVVGWGRISEGGNLADIVQEVQVPILSLAQCRASKYRPQRITANMICAGKGIEDSCQVCVCVYYIYNTSVVCFKAKIKSKP